MSKTGLSQREMGILYFLVSFILLAIVYKVVYVPFQARGEAMSQERLETSERLRKDRRLIRKATAQERKYRSFLQALSQTGSDEQVVSGMVDEIETAANANAVRVLDMKPQRVRKESGYRYFSVSVDFEGDMLALLTLIHSLQTSSSLFRVDEFRLERKTPNAQALQCSLLLGRTLIAAEEAPAK